MTRRSLPVAAALAATAALLLTACGGGDDKSSDNDKIAGADQESKKPTKSAEPAGSSEDSPDGVDVSLPKDMKLNLVFDWDEPKAKNEVAAMDDAANYVRALYRGVGKRTAEDAAVTAYSTGEGLRYAEVQINEWLKGDWTATGTRRNYDATTRSTANGNSVEVAFCTDSSKFYAKEVKTGKVLKTEPSLEDFSYFKIIMVKYPTSDQLWQASKVFVEEATKCQ
ncbi:hypothetical protein J8N05_09160 [Streptomyces sp. BH-SS-21]|uniref:Lipoprotein n=1 Tax=Streptomyces liliiviolaceus TaxID=2823109 RepID=A0A941B2Q1_9ACTN|nr:hypothetical protein [Streptomyces liliiviolaceus]MBQ0848380.1 hypothetical protein [Streptomyces liliiviolaceus]